MEDGKVGWAVCSDGLDVAVQLHLQLCRSAATLIPGAHPYAADPPSSSRPFSTCAFAWRAKVKLAFTTPSIVWLLVDNGGLVKPNLTLEAF